ncbi:LysM peptidoglycan-binding domain-containing protein [Veillonella montpellierensis]|uniref:LysM peptidoglycan-binding domain-containing protein n=1 Tax=Veillonella montpellierensis TaxID=187328 RepID=UPI0023F868C2|nr:LysM peptidoglycan-binding domain-containing protein [Veillonella montpellierensis]
MKRQIYMMVTLCLMIMIGYHVMGETVVLDTNNVQLVTVSNGDTIWSIAEKNSSNDVDIRDVVYSIKDLNHIEKSGELVPGSKLKIPTIKVVKPLFDTSYIARN